MILKMRKAGKIQWFAYLERILSRLETNWK